VDAFAYSLHINVHNVGNLIQALVTLTEFCQGPCIGNQQVRVRDGCLDRFARPLRWPRASSRLSIRRCLCVVIDIMRNIVTLIAVIFLALKCGFEWMTSKYN
jgi:hypothetical protein